MASMMTTTPTILTRDVSQDADGSFFAEASDLGWDVGRCPKRVLLRDDMGISMWLPLVGRDRGTEGEVTAFWYGSLDVQFVVFND